MVSLRNLLMERTDQLHIVPFDDRPGKLFEGLQNCRSVIFLSQLGYNDSHPALLTTGYQRWYAANRSQLFSQIQHTLHRRDPVIDGIFPKYSSGLEGTIFERLKRIGDRQISFFISNSVARDFIFYQEATRYWMKATFGLPYYSKNGVVAAPPHGRYLYFSGPETTHAVCAILNSSLFYAYFIAYSDCFHLSDGLVSSFPVVRTVLEDMTLVRLNKRLMEDLQTGAEEKTINTRDGDVITYGEYYASKSKPIIDEIDVLLAKHYELTDEERDFLVNYHHKFRKGLDEAVGEESA